MRSGPSAAKSVFRWPLIVDGAVLLVAAYGVHVGLRALDEAHATRLEQAQSMLGTAMSLMYADGGPGLIEPDGPQHEWLLSTVDELLRQAEQLAPGLARTAFVRGVWHLLEGQYDEAHDSFESALEVEPDMIDARIGLASWALRTARYEEAERLARSARDADEDHPLGHQILARVLMLHGQYDEALESIDVAIALRPRYAQFHWVRGILCQRHALWLEKQGDAQSTRAFLEYARDSKLEAVALSPNTARFHSSLARTLRHLGAYDRALAASLRALDLDPTDHETVSDVVEASLHLPDKDPALGAVRRARARDPEASDFYEEQLARLAGERP